MCDPRGLPLERQVVETSSYDRFGSLQLPPFLASLDRIVDSFCGQMDAARVVLEYSRTLNDAGELVEIELNEFRSYLSDGEFNELRGAVIQTARQINEVREQHSGPPVPTIQFESFRRDSVGFAYAKVVRQIARRMRRPCLGALVRRSLVGTCISEYEILLRRVVELVVRKYPNCAGQPDKAVTLKELRRLGDLASLESFISSQIADQLLREGLTVWGKWWQENFQFNYRATVPNWPSWREFFARRNLLVHNDGIVNQQYNQGVEAADVKTEGLRLEADDQYLEDRLGELHAAGVLLCALAALKFDPANFEMTNVWIVTQIGISAEEQHPHVGISIAKQWPIEALEIAPSRRDAFRIFEWICYRGAGRLDDVRDEIVAWDGVARGPYCQCARAVFLGDYASAATMIETLIDQGLLSKAGLHSDLLFKPVLAELLRYLPDSLSLSSDSDGGVV